MSFLRRAERRPGLLSYQRVLVPLAGNDADDVALRLTAVLLSGSQAQAALLHVIEVPFERQLDVEDEQAMSRAEQILEQGRQLLEKHGVGARTSMVQARVAGAAIVDDAVELGAELIVMGLPYKRRRGGQWDAGRTVPYVMRNSTAPVWCLRVETQELAHTP
jgi:nucleotide-binding universal stress UspA family protein